MTLGVASSDAMTLTSDGQMAIGPVAGTLLANVFCQLAIANPEAKGTRLLLEAATGTNAEIAFANKYGRTPCRNDYLPHHRQAMSFGTNSVQNVHIDGNGQIGIATTSPQAPLEIYDPARYIDANRSRSDQGHHLRNPGTILAQPDGGRIGIGLDNPAATVHLRNGGGMPSLVVETVTKGVTDTALTATGKMVSVGWQGPPRTVLDVVGNVAPGNAPVPASHVAVIENTQGAPSNVLAVKAAITDWSQPTNFITFLDDSNNYIGSIEGFTELFSSVTFFTGNSADYAEAVKRTPGAAQIGAGRVVGVSNGLVSLETDHADAIFVTSARPSMVGGAPAREHRGDYEFLAFLGQVSITVAGTCSPGDLIVPSGKGDGLGACHLARRHPGSRYSERYRPGLGRIGQRIAKPDQRAGRTWGHGCDRRGPGPRAAGCRITGSGCPAPVAHDDHDRPGEVDRGPHGGQHSAGQQAAVHDRYGRRAGSVDQNLYRNDCGAGRQDRDVNRPDRNAGGGTAAIGRVSRSPGRRDSQSHGAGPQHAVTGVAYAARRNPAPDRTRPRPARPPVSDRSASAPHRGRAGPFA